MAKKADTNGGKSITKAAAYRDAADKLGKSAPLDDVQKFLLDNFGIDMSKNQISQYRSNEKRRKPKRGRPRRDAEAAANGTPAPKKGGSISDFISTMRTWETRIGAAEICRAIDALYGKKA